VYEPRPTPRAVSPPRQGARVGYRPPATFTVLTDAR
jgi:hypothetical protein